MQSAVSPSLQVNIVGTSTAPAAGPCRLRLPMFARYQFSAAPSAAFDPSTRTYSSTASASMPAKMPRSAA